MPATAALAVQPRRAGQFRLSYSPMMQSLWHSVRGGWQRRVDRHIARAVLQLDHQGVSEDYRAACRRGER